MSPRVHSLKRETQQIGKSEFPVLKRRIHAAAFHEHRTGDECLDTEGNDKTHEQDLDEIKQFQPESAFLLICLSFFL